MSSYKKRPQGQAKKINHSTFISYFLYKYCSFTFLSLSFCIYLLRWLSLKTGRAAFKRASRRSFKDDLASSFLYFSTHNVKPFSRLMQRNAETENKCIIEVLLHLCLALSNISQMKMLSLIFR